MPERLHNVGCASWSRYDTLSERHVVSRRVDTLLQRKTEQRRDIRGSRMYEGTFAGLTQVCGERSADSVDQARDGPSRNGLSFQLH